MKKETILTYFNPEMAKEVGIPAALLYHELAWTSESEMAEGYDDDGWFYYTADKFEKRTTFKRNAYCDAIKKLEGLGLIEKKKAYIKGSSKSVNHFRLLKIWQPTVGAANTSPCCPDKQPIYKGNNKESIKVVGSPTPSSSAPHPQGHFSLLSDGERSEPNPMGTPAEPAPPAESAPPADPFAAPVEQVVSLKPTSSVSDEDKHAWAVTNEVTKYCQSKGLNVSPKNVQLKTAIKARLKDGATKEDIMKVAEVYCTTKDEFMGPKKKTLHAVFGVDNYEKYLNQEYQPKQTPKSYTF